MSSDSQIDILPDLKKLLRQTVGDQVSVVSYKASNLLPPGENYASCLYKVDVVVKKTKNSPEEQLQLVAKAVPKGEYVKNAMNSASTFGKEIFVMDTLATVYKQMEMGTKLAKEEHLTGIFPKYYGGQLTRSEDHPEDADENAILLLENIKVLGYDTMDRKKGLDFSHAKLALTQLARYHALGVALKTKKPALFEKSRKYMSDVPFELSAEEFTEIMDHTLNILGQDPRMSKYTDRIRATYEGHATWQGLLDIKPKGGWVTINHGDFWVNNIMFSHDHNGDVKDVKFVDFQLARICSPVCDIPYFLCGSVSSEVLEKHFDDLCDTYYDRFIEVLKKIDCDPSPFTKIGFEKELEEVSKRLLAHNILAAKFFTLEVAEDADLSDLKSAVMLTGASELFLNRVWYVVKKYLEKGWL